MFKNYGDCNFFDYGLLVEEIEENIYNIIGCTQDTDNENNYFFSECQIDITDSWIDKDDVCRYAGLRNVSIDYTEEEKLSFAIGVYSYYGAYHIGGETRQLKKNEIIDYINFRIEIDDCDFYNNNFLEDSRNLEIKLFYHTGSSHTYVYDTQDINLLEELYWLETGDYIEIVSK